MKQQCLSVETNAATEVNTGIHVGKVAIYCFLNKYSGLRPKSKLTSLVFLQIDSAADFCQWFPTAKDCKQRSCKQITPCLGLLSRIAQDNGMDTRNTTFDFLLHGERDANPCRCLRQCGCDDHHIPEWETENDPHTCFDVDSSLHRSLVICVWWVFQRETIQTEKKPWTCIVETSCQVQGLENYSHGQLLLSTEQIFAWC